MTIKNYNNIVVLTGAGVSAESGLKTFRDNDGLWENHRVEEVATPEAFYSNPELVQRFYNLRREQLKTCTPNIAHKALADFENNFSGNFHLITQNVDDLHERAGSNNVIHMHGELRKKRCTHCHTVSLCNDNITISDTCSTCNQQGTLRPHIVWFGEIPLFMDDIEAALSQCDLFISIGTSGNVYPAAGFYQMAKQFGAHTVELNLEASENGSHFDECHYGCASHIVPSFFQRISNR